ncbi:MAG: GGDEF domain-containing protein [Gammaproteobacteria bacterium]|jgi:diguanylate cyclase (GGDEF)-like protein|nr:GGDEF domain-containing protein [Gammaproteobacteria bacterium]MDH3750997.1 GGDEF domain-containing protein [Gammaproteobacteria bacterium]MDH3804956.1 GGDEF domain-containing protein [Gammaproteobacteria bacterium]
MSINRKILEQVIESSAEPLVIVRVDHPDWPVELSNAAFKAIGGEDTSKKPFADVIEQLVGRELALEISESVRSQQETSFPVEIGGREFLLALKPLALPSESDARFYVAFWRGGAGNGAVAGSDMHHALLNAKRRIRDLSRDDPVTGLLNGRAFREVLEHDWAVAAREKSTLALVVFTLDDFDAYIDVFGRHASDSCLRRVGQAIRRCLRRASDVVGRLDGAELIVLSHASDEDGVREFATRISAAVRELGLHHPRSTASKFVTVSFRVAVGNSAVEKRPARVFMNDLLSRAAE